MKLQPNIREMYFWQVRNGLSLSNQATSEKGSKEYRGYYGILPKPGGVGCVHSPQIPNIQNFSSDRSDRGAEKSCHGWQLQNSTRFVFESKRFVVKIEGISQFTLLWTPTLQVKPCLCNIRCLRLAYCTEDRHSTHKIILSQSQSRNHQNKTVYTGCHV